MKGIGISFLLFVSGLILLQFVRPLLHLDPQDRLLFSFGSGILAGLGMLLTLIFVLIYAIQHALLQIAIKSLRPALNAMLSVLSYLLLAGGVLSVQCLVAYALVA